MGAKDTKAVGTKAVGTKAGGTIAVGSKALAAIANASDANGALSLDSLKWLVISCPYCGEKLDVSVDCSVEYQQYIEDCQVCCRPMSLTVGVDENDQVQISARHEDE